MQLKLLLKKLEGYDIDTSMFPELYEEYFKKYSSLPIDYEFREEKGIFTNLEAIMMALDYFRPYFDTSEFSKLVCKKIISFSRLHCACMSGNPAHPELYVGNLARPSSVIPQGLSVECTKRGSIRLSTRLGYPQELVKF